MIRRCTVELLKSPTCNFFVSEGLVREAHKLTPHFKYEILLNGAPPQFHRYSAAERHRLRSRLGVEDCKVVAYAGRFEPVKSGVGLPDIFHRIALKYNGRVVIWTMGSGWQSDHVKRGFDDSCIDYKMWGKVAPERMPELFNCVEVVVLPSRLEGFPLVTIEALACGAPTLLRDIPVYQDWLTDGVNVWKGRDLVRLEEKLRGILTKQLPNLTGAGRRVAEARSLPRIGQALQQFYATLPAPQRNARPTPQRRTA